MEIEIVSKILSGVQVKKWGWIVLGWIVIVLTVLTFLLLWIVNDLSIKSVVYCGIALWISKKLLDCGKQPLILDCKAELNLKDECFEVIIRDIDKQDKKGIRDDVWIIDWKDFSSISYSTSTGALVIEGQTEKFSYYKSSGKEDHIIDMGIILVVPRKSLEDFKDLLEERSKKEIEFEE